MFILLKDHFSLQEMADCYLLLKLNEDGKTFSVVKERMGIFEKQEKEHYSMLKNYILSAFKMFKRKNNEETN